MVYGNVINSRFVNHIHTHTHKNWSLITAGDIAGIQWANLLSSLVVTGFALSSDTNNTKKILCQPPFIKINKHGRWETSSLGNRKRRLQGFQCRLLNCLSYHVGVFFIYDCRNILGATVFKFCHDELSGSNRGQLIPIYLFWSVLTNKYMSQIKDMSVTADDFLVQFNLFK